MSGCIELSYNLYFRYAIFGDFEVTLTMVTDLFVSRKMANLQAFLQRTIIFAGGSSILANILDVYGSILSEFLVAYTPLCPSVGRLVGGLVPILLFLCFCGLWLHCTCQNALVTKILPLPTRTQLR